jgi:predicted nucleic acid-binding protein
MSVVIDASILVAAATDTGAAGTFADRLLETDDVVAPHLVLVEATNVVRRLEMAKELTRLEAATARKDLLDLDIELVAFAPFAERVWALRGSITAYDAWYVAVAEAFDLPLATLDRRLTRAPGPSCRFLTPR